MEYELSFFLSLHPFRFSRYLLVTDVRTVIIHPHRKMAAGAIYICGRLGSFVCALGLLFWFFVLFHVFRIEVHPSRLDQLYNIRQCRG